ncbi:MAG: hypothetical protein MK111_22160 [Crocosphaera sp.]|uniref:helix-turn-helix transcriptional regulator n=1 Tax=Crocosphaera sp. TaxID=2729996 RepID=UPI002584502B|nr:hypothetical protein [Crocosphaera sp.]MCH2247299.1 hypothetical protein [Crocosphaera sp.]
MNNQISDIDQQILRLLEKGKKIQEIEIGGLSTKTIYGRIRNLRLEFGVKTNKELLTAYEKITETSKSA